MLLVVCVFQATNSPLPVDAKDQLSLELVPADLEDTGRPPILQVLLPTIVPSAQKSVPNVKKFTNTTPMLVLSN
jgi:hypothetical protein